MVQYVFKPQEDITELAQSILDSAKIKSRKAPPTYILSNDDFDDYLRVNGINPEFGGAYDAKRDQIVMPPYENNDFAVDLLIHELAHAVDARLRNYKAVVAAGRQHDYEWAKLGEQIAMAMNRKLFFSPKQGDIREVLRGIDAAHGKFYRPRPSLGTLLQVAFGSVVFGYFFVAYWFR